MSTRKANGEPWRHGISGEEIQRLARWSISQRLRRSLWWAEFDDMVSEITLLLLRNLSRDKWSPSKPYGIAAHVIKTVQWHAMRVHERKNNPRREFQIRCPLTRTMLRNAEASPVDDHAMTRDAELVAMLLKPLRFRERAVLEGRYGLTKDRTEKTLAQLGVQWKVTRERVRQIEARAVRRLRQGPLAVSLRAADRGY